MSAQDPPQSVATPGTQTLTATKNAPSPALLDDETASAILTTTAIHDAFLIGWSLQELKSRVLLRALGLQPSAPASEFTHETEPTTGTPGTQTPVLPFNMVDTLLKASLPSASPDTSQTPGLPGKSNKSIDRTSEWQAIFIRIVSVHDQSFPASTTENTLYDPSPTSPPTSRFPYLYPATFPNYALIGVSRSGSVGDNNFDDDAHLGKFKLYDVTRRALNCLNLLYIRPEESLLPDIIHDYQTRIVQSIFKHAQAPSNGTPATSPGASQQETAAALQESLEQEAAEILREYLNEAVAGPSQDDLNSAIKFLSFMAVRFLESWDGYLRENFYVGGRLKNNELELLAYEAGRSLSSLSWGISLTTVPLENASEEDSGAAQLLARLSTIWMNVFKSPYINTVQRQISALGPALDDAYYIIKKVPRPLANERPDPDLPGNAIRAITNSLVYWQRAVECICRQTRAGTTVSTTTTEAAIETTTTSALLNTLPMNTTVSTTTTEAAIETTTTSTTLTTSLLDETAQPLALTVELSRELRQALVNQAGIWQSLMLGEQTLRSFTTESVTKRILNNVMAQFESMAEKELLHPAQQQLKQLWTPFIGVGILLLIIVGAGLFLLVQTGQLQSLAAVIALLVGSALTLVSTVLTRASSTFFPASNEQPPTKNAAANNSNLDQRLSSMFGLAGEAIVTAFQNAYKQILIGFDDLNHYVAISYPLIDFFIMHSPQIDEEIKDSYIFLTKIAWTKDEQREEIERVARVAFGPLGALIGPRLNFFSSSKQSSPSTSNLPSVTQISSHGKSSTGLAAKT